MTKSTDLLLLALPAVLAVRLIPVAGQWAPVVVLLFSILEAVVTKAQRELSMRSFRLAQAIKQWGRWLLAVVVVGLVVGSAAALFLVLLRLASQIFANHYGLIALLPLIGLLMGWLYHRYGSLANEGNNLLIQRAQSPGPPVPLRMAPLILVTTLLSHAFGASVGREGTAMQMGASLSDQLGQRLGFAPGERPALVLMGMSAGFAALFGTPIAAALFAIEVLALGRWLHWRKLPLLWAVAGVAHVVCLAWGVGHDHYLLPGLPPWSWQLLMGLIVAAMAFGGVARLFVELVRGVSALARFCLPWPPSRPFVGGLVLALAAWWLPMQPYLGLGVEQIQLAFAEPLPGYDWLAKLLTTVWSVGAGFKGGEVTPLFYIGATLGNALALLLDLPLSLLAALGFVAVFAAASNTPLASSIMAAELFGWSLWPLALGVCYLSYWCAGYGSIYASQALGRGKYFGRPRPGRLG